MPGPKWTKDDDDVMRDLARAGLSARSIAIRYGVTRNAIIGRMYRANGSGILPRAKPKPLSAEERRERRRKRHQLRFERKRENGGRIRGRDIPLMEAQPLHVGYPDEGRCWWPYGDEPIQRTYCGQPCLPGHSYCPAHYKLSVRP